MNRCIQCGCVQWSNWVYDRALDVMKRLCNYCGRTDTITRKDAQR